MKSRGHRFTAIAVLLAAIAGACGGAASIPLTAVASDIGLAPKSNGFSFANFGASATSESFNTQDLVTMFGASACVDNNATTCAPTAQAGQWAQMVNDARISGHCEGLAVQASQRFNEKATPQTVNLKNEADVTHGIMRAFATQFLPEVQDATNQWSQKSLVEIVNELSTSFTNGSSKYTLGLYTETGGHAVLPYALEFPNKDLAVIKVYDSNWPGMDRYVVVDLKAQTWFFSFSGSEPQKDECAWTGGAGQMDITPIDARTAATCPFCGDGTKVTKSVLFIRSTTSNWSVKTKKGTYSPSNTEVVDGVNSRAIRSASCNSVIRLPEFVLSTDSSDFELNLPDAAAVYVSNGNSVVKILTRDSRKRKPILFANTSVAIADTTAQVTVAVDNVIVQITSDNAQVDIGENTMSIDVGGAGAPIEVTSAAPQVIITDTSTMAPDVQKVTTLVTLTPVEVPELTPDAVKPGLSPVIDRDLSNPVYAQDVLTSSSTTVPISAPPVIATTTTSTTTTVAKAVTTVAQQTGVTIANNVSSATTTAPQSGGSATTAAPSGGNSSSSSSTSSTTTQAPTTTNFSCTFVVGFIWSNQTIDGFQCSDGSSRGWTGKLHRFPGDEYVFNMQAGIPYLWGGTTIKYDVVSVPSGFRATGTYVGDGCHAYGCYP
jgi:hypothetical protein